MRIVGKWTNLVCQTQDVTISEIGKFFSYFPDRQLSNICIYLELKTYNLYIKYKYYY